ncbi:PAS domain S-box protein [Salinadaptatus halalkaliphilus]|uniref:histidine kinase n=1 Tax=Salinadaptatus halalkaliphilus TaxID=2419781 RepID=A0A4S3THN8_9EURY|nr:PAS domain S-box protein [Salinadaptatus halalkaliphilus]THE63010.1 PAS domain S-box protein [Salinadaptatus halalkaliphilus]
MSERNASPSSFWTPDGDPAPDEWCQSLVEAIDGGVVQFDRSLRICAADETLLEITGYGHNELVGAHASLLLSDATVAHLEESVTDTEQQDAVGEPSIDVGLYTAANTRRHCRFGVTPVRIDDQCHGAVGVLTPLERASSTTNGDIETVGADADGARPPAETDVTASSAFEAATTVLEDAEIGVFVLDEHFDVAWINETTERYFGIDRAAVLGRDKRQVIRETIRDCVADPDRFEETVTATYDDNTYVERFECHVTPYDDREERRLEHRSKPIEHGPFAGGRVELYYDITEQHDRAVQLRQLNDSLREWVTKPSREDVASTASRQLRSILGLEINGIYLYDEATDSLRPAGWSEPAAELFDEVPIFAAGEGVAWRVFESGEPEIYDDVRTDPDVYNPETPIRSEICLPIGDHGILLAGSQRPRAFDDGDRSLATVVASGLEVIFDQIRQKRVRERERAQTEQLLQTAPVAIAVEDAAGDTVVSNRRTRELLGVSDGLPLGKAGTIDGWNVYDRSGKRLAPEDAPVARARTTGTPVTDRELVLEGPTGDRIWVSVNAAPVHAADGSVARVISVAEDVTERKRHERQLERRKTELETELSEILGRISDAFYALDEEWRFTHVNDRAESLLGYSAEELVGEVVWDIFHHGRESDLYDRFQTAMDSQEAVSVERYSETLDIWMEVQAYPSESGLSVYFRDISDRKAREHQLLQYERIIETVDDGIYVLDADGQFTAVNEAYTELTGYDRSELIGAHASLVATDATVERARQLAADDNSVSTIETELQTSAGEWVPVEATITAFSRTDTGPERVGVVRDITERKDRQRRLEASEQRYRTLAEHFPNGMVALYDEDLRYTAAGGQLLEDLGIDRTTLIGQRIRERYPDDLVDDIESELRATLEGEERAFDVQYRGREFRAHTLPVDTPDGDHTGMLVVQDVTERVRYERKLEASNERLEQFAYAASHDLQEPLRMVTSYLGLIEQRYEDELDQDGQEFIDFAVDGAERMRTMIDGLLEYSRVETRGEPFEPVDLNDVLADVRKDLEVQIEESGADVTVESLPCVRGDASQLRQVFQNLLANAIEYSGDGPPTVTVSASRWADESTAASTDRSSSAVEGSVGPQAGVQPDTVDGSWSGETWIVSVTDEGIGIDPDDTDRIFGLFERLHGRDDGDGTGIGLALCRRIVQRHGGDIWVDSEPGVGSTFSVAIPAPP